MTNVPCLVLDHDDTVVQSESTINYPYFCYILDQFRPGEKISLNDYISSCFHLGFAQLCRQRYHFTDAEMDEEFSGWKAYIKDHIPDPFPGIARVIQRQKEAGGLVCVVSHSAEETILRDYRVHFGIVPDQIFGWDLPEEQRKPNAYPLEQIMKIYHLNANQLLVVDDMKPAWEMAQKANVPIAFAKWGKINCPEICKEMESLCDHSFETATQLEKYLFGV